MKVTKGTIYEQELKQRIAQNTLSGFYFFHGSENYLKVHYVQQIAEKCVSQDFAGFNLHRFDGQNVSIDDIAEAVNALPLFSEKSCVIVHDLPIYSLGKNQFKKLTDLAEDAPDYCVFILLMDTVVRKQARAKKDETESEESDNETVKEAETSDDEPLKVNPWDELLKIAQSKNRVIELNSRSDSQLVDLLKRGAQQRDRLLPDDAAAYLIALVGRDIATLQNELNKICSYSAPGRAISKADIDAVTTKSVEENVFKMAEYLLARDTKKAYFILDSLLSQKVHPLQIMGAFITTFVDIYRVSVMLSSGGRALDVAEIFNYKKKEFRLNNAARVLSRMSTKTAGDILLILEQTDLSLKRKVMDEQWIIEQAMAKILLAMR